MGGVYSCLGTNSQLPEQVEFCNLKSSSCGYLQQHAGRRWLKRLAVLTEDGTLFLYKFYLYRISPGAPLMGRVYNVRDCKRLKMTLSNQSFYVTLTTRDGQKLRLKLKGDHSKLCAEALRQCVSGRETCMRSLDDAPACSPQTQGLPLLLDGPLSFIVIVVGIIGNVYCISVLYKTSINIGMLVSLTALAIWDVILLLASLGHHSLWATLHYFGWFPWLWDTYKVALDGLLECAHLTSTWMLLQVSATRFLAVSRPFHVARSKGRKTTFAKVAIGLIRMPLLMTIGACLVTIPCSFEYVLKSCRAKGVYQFEREENSWAQSTVYFLIYRTLLLAFLKTFGPFTIIAFLTVNTLRSMRKSMNSRANILKQQGKGLLFEVDKDKTKSLQTISTLLLGKFLILRCWPTFVAVMRVLLNFQDSPDVSRAAEFMLLLNSATNSFVFVVIKAAFETRRLKRIRTYQRQLVMMHAEQVLSIGRMLAVKHDSDVETSEES